MSWSPPLAPQQPASKKKPLFNRNKGRNTYRQRAASSQGREKFWVRLLLVNVGFLSLAGICLGLVLLYYHLLTSPFFCIKDMSDIDLSGTKRLDSAHILAMAGLGPGSNLLALRPAPVEQTLEAHPWIAAAELTRIWPNRLQLSIQEREPVALVQLGELYYADREGNLFKPFSPGDPHDFPVITGLMPEQFVVGQGFPPMILAGILSLLDHLQQTPPPLNLSNISEIHVDPERGFTLYAVGIKSAIHVGPQDFSEKLQKFALIWPFLQQQGYQSQIEYINLNYPQKVLLSLKGPVEEVVGRAQ
jgi:cell division protein FtsQ